MPTARRCSTCGQPSSPEHLQRHITRFAVTHGITEDEALRFLERQATSLAEHKRQRAAQDRQAHLHRLWLAETTKEHDDAQ